jgi:hypothetical protein
MFNQMGCSTILCVLSSHHSLRQPLTLHSLLAVLSTTLVDKQWVLSKTILYTQRSALSRNLVVTQQSPMDVTSSQQSAMDISMSQSQSEHTVDTRSEINMDETTVEREARDDT